MRKKLVHKLTKILLYFLPPIISQRVRNKLCSYAFARDNGIDFRRNSFIGGKYLGNTSDYHSYIFYFHGFYDWRNIIVAKAFNKYVKGNIIEVGGNVGTETVCYARIANKNGFDCYTFEPSPVLITDLEKLQSFHPNLKVINNAVSDKIDTLSFKVAPKEHSGQGKLVDSHESNDEDIIKVNTIKIDDYFKDQINKISFIQIDVEGHELSVLLGAKKIIEKNRPGIILEVILDLQKKSFTDQLIEFFESLEYDLYSIGKIGLRKINTQLNDYSEYDQNWLAIPREHVNLIQKIDLRLKLFLFNIVSQL